MGTLLVAVVVVVTAVAAEVVLSTGTHMYRGTFVRVVYCIEADV